jgi:hypothetical protein
MIATVAFRNSTNIAKIDKNNIGKIESGIQNDQSKQYIHTPGTRMHDKLLNEDRERNGHGIEICYLLFSSQLRKRLRN